MTNLYRAVLALAFVFALTLTASAHTTIVASNIEAGDTVQEMPDAFECRFGKSVRLAGVTVETLAGTPVAIDFKPVKTAGTEFTVAMPDLSNGTYVLKWRALAKDGHVMKGQIDFTVVGTS